MSITEMHITLLLPEILLFILACGVLIVDMVLKKNNTRYLWDISFVGLLIILFAIVQPLLTQRWSGGGTAFNGQAYADSLSVFIRLIIVSTLFTALIFSVDWINKTPQRTGTFIFLTMISALGALVLSSAGDLIVLLIGLEILSLPLYVLAGFQRGAQKGREASFKYFILGSFASAFLALGIVLIFGATRTVNMGEITRLNAAGGFSNSIPLIIGTALLISTLAFKGGLMPFYAWIPDVYRGSPDYVVGFMAAVAKVAVYGTFIRISMVFIPISGSFIYLLGFLYLTTVILGNLMALWQNDIKRMLAYSSVAHAGYLVLGIMALGGNGYSAIIFYLLIYAFSVMGSFIITGFVKQLRGGYTLSDFDGLHKDQPVLALLMSIFMFTLAGIPPLAGFWSKLFLFNAAVIADFEEFVIGILASLVGVYYYIRVMVRMYMNPAPEDVSEITADDFPGFFTRVAMYLVGILVVILGFFPGSFFDAVNIFMKEFVMGFLVIS